MDLLIKIPITHLSLEDLYFQNNTFFQEVRPRSVYIFDRYTYCYIQDG